MSFSMPINNPVIYIYNTCCTSILDWMNKNTRNYIKNIKIHGKLYKLYEFNTLGFVKDELPSSDYDYYIKNTYDKNYTKGSNKQKTLCITQTKSGINIKRYPILFSYDGTNAGQAGITNIHMGKYDKMILKDISPDITKYGDCYISINKWDIDAINNKKSYPINIAFHPWLYHINSEGHINELYSVEYKIDVYIKKYPNDIKKYNKQLQFIHHCRYSPKTFEFVVNDQKFSVILANAHYRSKTKQDHYTTILFIMIPKNYKFKDDKISGSDIISELETYENRYQDVINVLNQTIKQKTFTTLYLFE